jgi:Mg2+-importing ATPase
MTDKPSPTASLSTLFEQLQTSDKGLTSAEAKRRLSRFGANELTIGRRSGAAVQILLLFANPLAIILLIASVISALLGEVLNASIIAAMVLLSAALNFTQTFRSQRAAEKLRLQVHGGFIG